MARTQVMFLIWLIFFQATLRGNSAKSRHHVKNFYKYHFIDEIVPKECEELGYCEETTQYPTELAEKLIRKLRATNAFLDTDVDRFSSEFEDSEKYRKILNKKYRNTIEQATNVTLYTGFVDPDTCDVDDISYLCMSEVKKIVPLMARDVISGLWYYVLNSIIDPLQEYKGQKCSKDSGANEEQCSAEIILKDGYESKCLQKNATRTVVVIRNKDTVTIPVDMPWCCTCVAVEK